MTKAAQILRMERLPFALTALIAAAGWGVIHIVDRVTTTPAVEVRVEELAPTTQLQVRASVGEDGESVPTDGRRFILTNLSRSVLFRDLTVKLDCRHGSDDPSCGIVAVGVVGRPPADSPAWLIPKAHPKLAHVPLPFLHPGQRVEVFVTFIGPGTPDLRLADPDPADKEDQVRTGGERVPVRLVTPSLATWFVRHEEAVVGIASAGWAGLAIAYLFLVGLPAPRLPEPQLTISEKNSNFSLEEEGGDA